MAGRNPADALENYLRPLQRAVHCISKTATLITDCHDPRDGLDHFLSFAGNEPVRVSNTRGDVHFLVMVRQRFRIVSDDNPDRGPWKATTRQYEYSISDAESRELLAYHWHPGEQGFDEPHLHVPSHTVADLHKAHLPTGRVSLEAFIVMAIREFSVHAQNEGYKKLLDHSEGRFLRFKRW